MTGPPVSLGRPDPADGPDAVVVIRPDGEGAKTVEPGSRLAARAMTIDVGPASGRIFGIQAAGAPHDGAPAGEGER